MAGNMFNMFNMLEYLVSPNSISCLIFCGLVLDILQYLYLDKDILYLDKYILPFLISLNGSLQALLYMLVYFIPTSTPSTS